MVFFKITDRREFFRITNKHNSSLRTHHPNYTINFYTYQSKWYSNWESLRKILINKEQKLDNRKWRSLGVSRTLPSFLLDERRLFILCHYLQTQTYGFSTRLAEPEMAMDRDSRNAIVVIGAIKGNEGRETVIKLVASFRNTVQLVTS